MKNHTNTTDSIYRTDGQTGSVTSNKREVISKKKTNLISLEVNLVSRSIQRT